MVGYLLAELSSNNLLAEVS